MLEVPWLVTQHIHMLVKEKGAAYLLGLQVVQRAGEESTGLEGNMPPKLDIVMGHGLDSGPRLGIPARHGGRSNGNYSIPTDEIDQRRVPVFVKAQYQVISGKVTAPK